MWVVGTYPLGEGATTGRPARNPMVRSPEAVGTQVLDGSLHPGYVRRRQTERERGPLEAGVSPARPRHCKRPAPDPASGIRSTARSKTTGIPIPGR
jgi:hypothetical protein